MQRVRVTVERADGSVESVVLRPVALVAAERHFKGAVPAMEGTLWAMHYQQRTEEPFGDWLESLVAISEEAENPTSATTSAPSPSSP